MRKKIKVFRLNEYEWWAGKDLKSVKKHYLEVTGVPPEEAFDDPYELSDADMEEFKFHCDDYECSFKSQLTRMKRRGVKFPSAFAFTEC